MIRLLLFIAVLVFFSKAEEQNDALSSFLQWSSHYIPHVKDPMKHYQTWKRTWDYVQEHNANHSSGLVDYSLSMNQFALQRDPHILPQIHNQFIPDHRNEEHEYPFDVDWRTKGIITPVQYDGCSQVLALVDAVDSAAALKTGHLVPFSAEEVSDCCFGCICDPGPQQADPPTACVKRNGGLCRDIDYPWTTNMCMCHECIDGSVRQPVQDYQTIANGSEKDLVLALKKQPVIVAIDSSDPSLKVRRYYELSDNHNYNHSYTRVEYIHQLIAQLLI